MTHSADRPPPLAPLRSGCAVPLPQGEQGWLARERGGGCSLPPSLAPSSPLFRPFPAPLTMLSPPSPAHSPLPTSLPHSSASAALPTTRQDTTSSVSPAPQPGDGGGGCL